MKQVDKYKLEAVNHDGSESVIVWTSDDRDYLMELVTKIVSVNYY